MMLEYLFVLIFGKKITLKSAEYKDEVMTLTYSDKSQVQYKGSSTVWHKMPLMKRCHTSTEQLLSEIYTYIQHYGNPYPTAHKKTE